MKPAETMRGEVPQLMPGLLGRILAAQAKIASVYGERQSNALRHSWNGVLDAIKAAAPAFDPPPSPRTLARDLASYALDAAQRHLLFWDTIRQRGNGWIEHERQGKPPLLDFDTEVIADARNFERPVNYALLRIVPPAGQEADPNRRPFVIIDPRAGHGPGIGGFKQDSQVGVAMRAGHPVYFVVFSPEPEPGQTLADVSVAEAEFLRIVGNRHPKTRKPVVVGNCQGGWAAMLVGALDPSLPGPIVINGAPMSYWAGNDGENPMRYAGGVLGGVWPALLASDLGAGLFDGAYLVDNFEYLNPANTYFSKAYALYSKIDTEPPRYLEFERWWGGFFMMNRQEIRWIVENLFVGNSLAAGKAEWGEGLTFDLRDIRSPIILFASLGDNITPPQQAFNWVADVYPTTRSLKENGQVIVGLMHESVGHLGIFVSGKIAQKEHRQIVDLIEYIEHLPPGLYGMRITETEQNGEIVHDVVLTERRVEDLAALQTFARKDEIAFEAVARTSKRLAKAYDSLVHPLMKQAVPPSVAKAARMLHPQRVRRWALSDANPVLRTLAPAAEIVRANRAPAAKDNRFKPWERAAATLIPAWLDLARDFRDATVEAIFFQAYMPLSLIERSFRQPEQASQEESAAPGPIVAHLHAAGENGRIAGLVRIALLVARAGGSQRRLSVMKRVRELVGEDAGLVALPADVARAVVREQAALVEADGDAALETLPEALPRQRDRRLALSLLDKVLDDLEETPAQLAMADRIRNVLRSTAGASSDEVPFVSRGLGDAVSATSRSKRQSA